jgi:hypothetical protein
MADRLPLYQLAASSTKPLANSKDSTDLKGQSVARWLLLFFCSRATLFSALSGKPFSQRAGDDSLSRFAEASSALPSYFNGRSLAAVSSAQMIIRSFRLS